MPDITDAEAIKFVNEVIRPLAEEARAIRLRVQSATTKWYGGINTKIPNDTSPIADGREAEGISRLTGIDVNNLMGQLIGKIGDDSTGLNSEIVEKPCVRPVEVR